MHNTNPSCDSSKIFNNNLSFVALLICGAFCFVPNLFADTVIWSGGGATANWSDSGNWFGVVPANGDILVFQGGQPKPTNTNNIVGLTLNQIRFIGASGGYNIFGNSFALSNSVSSIEATNTVGVNTISNNIIGPSPNLVVNVATGAKLIFSGVLSGAGGVVKNGAGTNAFTGRSSNTYLGTTTVNSGLLEMLKDGVSSNSLAIPGNLIIGDGVSTATVRNLVPEDIVNSASVTINASGAWDLVTFFETIGTSLTLNGGNVNGTGSVILSPNNTVAITGNSAIYANLNVGSGTCTIQNNSAFTSLTVFGVISGSADITKNGFGSITFGNQNTFTGSITVNDGGYLWINHPLGLGTTNGGSTFNGSTSLAISGNITVTNEALTLNTTSTLGIQNFLAETNTWTGPVTFGTNSTISVVTNGSFTISGTPSGPGGFKKTGPGLLTLSGSGSSYAGDTTVNEGILLLGAGNVIRHGTLTIGDGICYNTNGVAQPSDIVRYLPGGSIFGGLPDGATVVIKSTGWLDLNGQFDDVGPIAMDGGQITTGAGGTLSLFEPFVTYKTDGTNGSPGFTGNLNIRQTSTFGITNGITINGPITSSGTIGAYSLFKTGPDYMIFSGSNSYTGPTIIQQGVLYAENAAALGTTNSGTVVSNHATLALYGPNLGFTNEPLFLNGQGASSLWGNLDVETNPGTNFWAGPITVNADSTITAYYGGSVLRIPGQISGAGGVTTLLNGSGIIYFDGSTSNSYAGVTRVQGGTLLLNKSFTDGAIPGDVTVGSTLRLVTSQQINDAADVFVQGGLFDFGAQFEGINTLHGFGSVTFATSGYLNIGVKNGSSTFDGLMSGTGFIGGWTIGKFGTGTFTLTAGNTYLNQSHVFAGTMIINGSQPQSPAVVEAGATLGGSGTVGDILCAGHLSPGNSPGILTCSNLTFVAGATLHEEISGRFPGTTYDQMNVRGTNNLANAALALTFSLNNGASVGDQIVMINNDGVEAITGTFAGYPPGSSYSANGFTFVISYNGGTGNDAVFTVTSIPGGVVSSSVTAGNGDHIVGPNECNNLNVVVTNTTGTPMTGISATLSTTTPGVEITQPYSSYANIPVNGKGTNIAPFQISTLPSFACGQDITLQLTVHPVSHGAFTVPFTVRSGTPGNAPSRYDVSTVTNIPDVGAIESTNVVTGFSGLLAKVAVSMWLTHPIDSDLSLSLISPDGTTVNLTSGNGGGANFGSSCSPDANRTIFDDAGLFSITAGSPPYVGTFRPQTPLSAFFETSQANGNWRLHVTDSVGGSVGALRCWSLLLYPIVCAPGSGICSLCSPPIIGSITTNDPVEVTRLFRNGFVSSCNSLKPFPGTSGANLHYKAHTFSNTSGADACVTVELAADCDVFAGAYLNSFDPTNIANNYVGDIGSSTTGGGTNSCSFLVPNGATFVIVVNEVNSNIGCDSYALTISGLPCPAPALSVEDVPGPNAHLFWPNSAGGYLLESSPLVQPTTWSVVTNEPIILNGNYNVTNTTTAPSQFYRLHKP